MELLEVMAVILSLHTTAMRLLVSRVVRVVRVVVAIHSLLTLAVLREAQLEPPQRVVMFLMVPLSVEHPVTHWAVKVEMRLLRHKPALTVMALQAMSNWITKEQAT
jgi:hypothetical protein